MGARLAGCLTPHRRSTLHSPPRSPRLARNQHSIASFSKEERVSSPTTRNFKISAISSFPEQEKKKASELPSLESLPDVDAPGRELKESSPRHRKHEEIPQKKTIFTDEMAAATFAIADDINENTPEMEFAVKMKLVKVSAEREVGKAEIDLEMMVDEKILVVNADRDIDRIKERENQLEEMKKILNEKKELLIQKQMKKNEKFEELKKPTEDIEKEEKERAYDQQKSFNCLMETIQNLDRRIFKKRCSLVVDRKPEAQLECDAYLFTSKFIDFLVSFLCSLAFYLPLTLIFILGRIFGKFKGGNLKNDPGNLDNSKTETNNKPSVPSFNILDIPQSYFLWLKIMIFSMFLIIPGTLVVITQSFCLIKLGELESSTEESDTFSDLMHVLLVVFYFFLSMNEVASSFKVIFYFCKIIHVTWQEENTQDTVKKEKRETKDVPTVEDQDKKVLNKNQNGFKSYFKIIVLALLTVLKFLPQLVQIAFCFWFCYINIYLIEQFSSTTDLIRNFAALAILLEFDTLVMSFLRYLKFKEIYDYFYQTILNDEPKEVDSEIEREIKKDEEKLQELIRDLEIEKFSTDLEVENLENLVQNILKMQEKLKEKRVKLEKAIGNDVIDYFSKFDVENLMNEIPKFMKVLFKSRNEDLQILMSAEKFVIPNKYRKGSKEDIEKSLFNWIGFAVIMIGILLVMVIFYLQS